MHRKQQQPASVDFQVRRHVNLQEINLPDLSIGHSLSMHMARIPNRSSPPAFLLREPYREDRKVKTRTLNPTKLSHQALRLLERFLQSEHFVSAETLG